MTRSSQRWTPGSSIRTSWIEKSLWIPRDSHSYGKAHSAKVSSPKSSNPSLTIREYNSDLMLYTDLDEEEDTKSPTPERSQNQRPRKLDLSEIPLETARFQDPMDIPERQLPPKPTSKVDFRIEAKSETPEPVAETPRQPGEPIVNHLQRTYKASHKVPKELLEGQTVDGLRQIIEILISDKLNLLEQVGGSEPQAEKKTPNSSISEEDLRPSNPNYSFTTTQSNSIMKQRMFPVRGLGNQEELMMRRKNNQSTYQRPPERESIPTEIDEVSLTEVEPKPLAKTMKAFDGYEVELVRLTTEVEDLKAKNELLSQVLRLAPDKRKVAELTNQMQARLKQQTAVIQNLMDENAALKARIQMVGVTERLSSCTPSRAASPAGSAFQGGSQLFTTYEMDAQSSLRRVSPKPLATLKELVTDEENTNLKPEEKQVLQTLIELHSNGEKKQFVEYADALLAKHDSAEIISVMVRHIRYLEEDVFYSLRKQVLELRTKGILLDTCYQEALNEKAKAEVELKETRSSLEDMKMELDKVNNRVQLELRRSKAEKSLGASKSTSRMLEIRSSGSAKDGPRELVRLHNFLRSEAGQVGRPLQTDGQVRQLHALEAEVT